MSEELADEQSHYEISLTAGQAFIAFVLLLLSLAASFAFGLMIGRGQGDDRLVVKKEPAVVTEASVVPKKTAGKIVELGVADEDFSKPATPTDTATAAQPLVTGGTENPSAPTDSATAAGVAAAAAVSATSPAPAEAKPAPGPETARPAPRSGPVYAQLLSTSDQKTAETMAAKLINGGFTSAYVERGSGEKGTIFRVRVPFGSDADAHAAEGKLREFSKDVWITK